MMSFVRTMRFVRWLEHRPPTERTKFTDEPQRQFEECPFLVLHLSQWGEVQVEAHAHLALLQLRGNDFALLVSHVKAEFARPAGAAEELADHAVVLPKARLLLRRRVAGRAAEPANQHLEPPADRAE